MDIKEDGTPSDAKAGSEDMGLVYPKTVCRLHLSKILYPH